MRKGCWASVRVRATRVILNVGSSSSVDFDAAAKALDTDWSAVGKGLYLKLSDRVNAYTVEPDAVPDIAARVVDLADDARRAIDALIATIPVDGEEEPD